MKLKHPKRKYQNLQLAYRTVCDNLNFYKCVEVHLCDKINTMKAVLRGRDAVAAHNQEIFLKQSSELLGASIKLERQQKHIHDLATATEHLQRLYEERNAQLGAAQTQEANWRKLYDTAKQQKRSAETRMCDAYKLMEETKAQLKQAKEEKAAQTETVVELQREHKRLQGHFATVAELSELRLRDLQNCQRSLYAYTCKGQDNATKELQDKLVAHKSTIDRQQQRLILLEQFVHHNTEDGRPVFKYNSPTDTGWYNGPCHFTSNKGNHK